MYDDEITLAKARVTNAAELIRTWLATLEEGLAADRLFGDLEGFERFGHQLGTALAQYVLLTELRYQVHAGRQDAARLLDQDGGASNEQIAHHIARELCGDEDDISPRAAGYLAALRRELAGRSTGLRVQPVAMLQPTTDHGAQLQALGRTARLSSCAAENPELSAAGRSLPCVVREPHDTHLDSLGRPWTDPGDHNDVDS